MTQLLLYSGYSLEGMRDAENRDYFGFSDLQKQFLAAWGKGVAGAGVSEWISM